MKNLLLLVLATLLISCQKDEVQPETFEGKWELRHILGVQVAGAPSEFEKGNGNIIEFSADRYKRIENGKILDEGTYKIVETTAEIDGNTYEKAIVFNDTASPSCYIRMTGNKLLICYGSIALDGSTLTYERY